MYTNIQILFLMNTLIGVLMLIKALGVIVKGLTESSTERANRIANEVHNEIYHLKQKDWFSVVIGALAVLAALLSVLVLPFLTLSWSVVYLVMHSLVFVLWVFIAFVFLKEGLEA